MKQDMKRKQALLLYLVGTLGQILLVSLLVWLLRVGGVRVDYGTPIGLFTLILGGLDRKSTRLNSSH